MKNDIEEIKDINEDKGKKNTDLTQKVVLTAYILIGTVTVLSVLFALNIFNVRNNIKEKIIDNLLADRIESISDEIEERYSNVVIKSFEEERAFIENENQLILQKQAELNETQKYIDELKAQIEESLNNITQKEKEIYGEFENVSELSKVYSGMDPKKAAEILTSMENIQLVRNIIFSMKLSDSALILAEMKNEFAALITENRYTDGVIP